MGRKSDGEQERSALADGFVRECVRELLLVCCCCAGAVYCTRFRFDESHDGFELCV